MFNDNKNIKEIYEFCVDNKWNITKIREFAYSLNMTYEDTLYKVLEYAKKNVSVDEYNKIYKLISKGKRGRYELDVPNPFLLKKGEVVYRIWRNDVEKNEVLKYIYDSWRIRDTKEIAEEFCFDTDKVLRLVREYAFEVLGLSPLMWQMIKDEVKMNKSRNKKRENLENITGSAKILLQLVHADSFEKVVNLLDSVDDFINLRNSIHDYLVIYHDIKDYDKYRDLLTSRITLYSAYKKEKEKQKMIEEQDRYILETLPSAVQLITTFVESDCNSVQEFIETYKIVGNKILNGERIFKECLKLVRRYNLPLYGKYMEKVERRRQQNYNIITNQVMTVISLLKNGIIENGVKRPFDVIDYLQLSRFSFSSMRKVADDMLKKHMISAKDYSLFAGFIRSVLNAEKVKYGDIDLILKEKIEINCQKNEKGYPIPNTGEMVSDESKEKIINYLINNNIPVNYHTYHILLNRYKNGFLDLNDAIKR